MQNLIRLNRVLLTGLSIMTGLVKLFQMDDEMQIFWGAGFSTTAIVVFGVVQLLGGLLLIPPQTTRYGAALMIPTFVIATGVLFVNGLYPFGVFSVLFVASAAVAVAFPHWTRPHPLQ